MNHLEVAISDIVKSGTWVNQHGKNSKCAKLQVFNLQIDLVIATNVEITNEIIVHIYNELIKGPHNYNYMPNLKQIKLFLLCFQVLKKSLMKLITELLKESYWNTATKRNLC